MKDKYEITEILEQHFHCSIYMFNEPIMIYCTNQRKFQIHQAHILNTISFSGAFFKYIRGKSDISVGGIDIHLGDVLKRPTAI